MKSITFLLVFLTSVFSFAQTTDEPPPPLTTHAPPPPGLPIDDHLWVLTAVALIFGMYLHLKRINKIN